MLKLPHPSTTNVYDSLFGMETENMKIAIILNFNPDLLVSLH